MRIYNKKLAARIRQNEARLTQIRSKQGEITESDAQAEKSLQAQVNADLATLRQHGYNRHGDKATFADWN